MFPFTAWAPPRSGPALGRAGGAGDEVDEVILGCVGEAGPGAYNVRRCARQAGAPRTVPGYKVNRLCSSGLQAIWSGGPADPDGRRRDGGGRGRRCTAA